MGLLAISGSVTSIELDWLKEVIDAPIYLWPVIYETRCDLEGDIKGGTLDEFCAGLRWNLLEG